MTTVADLSAFLTAVAHGSRVAADRHRPRDGFVARSVCNPCLDVSVVASARVRA